MVFLAAGYGLLITVIALWAIVRLSDALTAQRQDYLQAQKDWAAERRSLITEFHGERSELLNRVKPEAPQYPVTGGPVVHAVSQFSDEDYWDNTPKEIKDMIEEASENGLHE